jgi:hypothetical protein
VTARGGARVRGPAAERDAEVAVCERVSVRGPRRWSGGAAGGKESGFRSTARALGSRVVVGETVTARFSGAALPASLTRVRASITINLHLRWPIKTGLYLPASTCHVPGEGSFQLP